MASFTASFLFSNGLSVSHYFSQHVALLPRLSFSTMWSPGPFPTEQVPIELGNLTVKKLQAVKLQGNPLSDARIRRFVEEDSPTLVKDLLNHVRKNGYKGEAAGGGKQGGGGRKGKKGKAKAAPVEEEKPRDE